MSKMIINFNYDNGIRTMEIDGVMTKNVLGNEKEKLIPFIRRMKEEVRKQPKSQRKAIIKHLQVMAASLVVVLQTSEKTQAQTLQVYQSEGMSMKSDLLPPEITDILKQLILACEGVAILLACIFLIISGIYWMMGNKTKSKQWTEDIIKGLGLTVLAPVTIMLLVKIVSIVFKNTPVLEGFF